MKKKSIFGRIVASILALAFCLSPLNLLSEPFVYVLNIVPGIPDDTGEVLVIDAATDSIVTTFSYDRFSGDLMYNPQNNLVYVLLSDPPEVFFIDTTTNSQLGTSLDLSSNLGSASGIALGGTGEFYYVVGKNLANDDNAVIEILTSLNATTNNIPLNAGETSDGAFIAIPPLQAGFNTKAYTTASNQDKVYVVDLVTKSRTEVIDVGMSPFYVRSNNDGTAIYVPNNLSDTVSVISTATDTVSDTISVSGPSFVSFDQTQGYISSISMNNITIFNSSTNALTGTIPVGATSLGIEFVQNPLKAYVALADTMAPANSTVGVLVNEALSNTIADSGRIPTIIVSTDSFIPTPPPLPEDIRVSARCLENRFLTQKELAVSLTWCIDASVLATPTEVTITEFKIYRDVDQTDLAATISASAPYEFVDHNRPQGTFTYVVVALEGSTEIFTGSAVVICSPPQ